MARLCLYPQVSSEPRHVCTLSPLLPADRRGAMGLLALPQPSAVALVAFEEVGNVQQSLTDVVPKALGVLWEPKFRPGSGGVHALDTPSWALHRPEWGTLTVSELENLLEIWKNMVFSPAIM